ncbi:MAG: hypothetical protein NTV55_13790 [Planctomycetota bacterium]|nr:hypothetical protein [Planctomycetota bacterium]
MTKNTYAGLKWLLSLARRPPASWPVDGCPTRQNRVRESLSGPVSGLSPREGRTADQQGTLTLA